MAKVFSESPLATEGGVWCDRNSGEAHDDVRHSHVHQIHLSVWPQNFGPVINYFSKNMESKKNQPKLTRKDAKK